MVSLRQPFVLASLDRTLSHYLAYISSYASIGPAIPAILMIAALGVMFYDKQNRTIEYRASQYRSHFTNASAAKDYKTALIAVSSLIDLDPENPDYRFQQALLQDQLGQTELALELMAQLSLKRRYGLAALWIIQKKYDLQTLETWQPADHENFRLLESVALQACETTT